MFRAALASSGASAATSRPTPRMTPGVQAFRSVRAGGARRRSVLLVRALPAHGRAVPWRASSRDVRHIAPCTITPSCASARAVLRWGSCASSGRCRCAAATWRCGASSVTPSSARRSARSSVTSSAPPRDSRVSAERMGNQLLELRAGARQPMAMATTFSPRSMRSGRLGCADPDATASSGFERRGGLDVEPGARGHGEEPRHLTVLNAEVPGGTAVQDTEPRAREWG